MRFAALQTQPEVPPPPPQRAPTFVERVLEAAVTMVLVQLILRTVLFNNKR